MRDKKIIMKNITSLIKAVSVTLTAVLILIFPAQTAESTVKSIDVCISTIIPSMFAFMAISAYIQNTGLYRIILRPLIFLLRPIIKADDSIISVFLMSLIGGYPVGVKLLAELTAENNNFPEISQTAENASMFCFCISPTVSVIMIGNGVFGNTAAGAMIYISDILACLVMAMFVSRIHKTGSTVTLCTSEYGLADAVNSASRALFTVCTVIIAFNVVLTCIRCALSIFGADIPPLAAGAAEISNLLKIKEPSLFFIPAAAAVSSFGGICVLMQCTAIIKGAFSVKKFLLARIPCAALSALFSYIIMQFSDISVTVSTFSRRYSFGFSANKVIVLVLIAMCIIIFYTSDKIFRKV